MIHDTDFEFRKNLILASAHFHAFPPDEDGYSTANCARVIRNALKAADLWDDLLERGQAAAFHGIYDDFPLVELWYSTLISLTRCVEPEQLLQGAGNLDAPAGASFTACWLTPHGQKVAVQLLNLHPDWRIKLTQEKPRHES